MKKLLNSAETFISDQLAGFALAHPELAVNFDPDFIVRRQLAGPEKVTLISGGGGGHEPLHGGYVGHGMLDGACPGNVFTAPTPDQMYACAKQIGSENGVLFVVKNYTGDVLSFETAIEMLHAEGVAVGSILIDDDISIKHAGLSVGRRGTGGTVVVEKIVGAAALAGLDLNQCAQLGQHINVESRTIGLALTSCIVPERGVPTFALDANQVEIGIGIHGEHGQATLPIDSADNLVAKMVDELLAPTTYQRSVREWDRQLGGWIERSYVSTPLKQGDRVLAIVNNMGSTPLAELYIVYRKLAELCADAGIEIVRQMVGTYVTSLDMQGCSITLVRMDDEMLRYWDAPVCTPTLRWGM